MNQLTFTDHIKKNFSLETLINHHKEHHEKEEELKEFITELLETCKYARTGYINLVDIQVLPSEEYDNESLEIANQLEAIIIKTKKLLI